MRHRKKRHLRGSHGRKRQELRALTASLVLYERIKTTEARAKITRRATEKMITRGKIPGLTSIRLLKRDLPINAVKKIIEVLGPRYQNRPGGYTRIVNVGKFKDGTRQVMLEFVK